MVLLRVYVSFSNVDAISHIHLYILFSCQVRAFEATFGDLRSTFIDTPGHAAFMAMRESGAAATDVVLLVVSAKDGVKDQTLETLRIAAEHELPIVLALNKIDLLDQYERENLRSQVESDLLTHGFASESLGGEIQVVEISAKTSEGLENLEEALMLQTEILELNTNLAAPGEALILESQIDPQLGTCFASHILNPTVLQIYRRIYITKYLTLTRYVLLRFDTMGNDACG